MTVVGTQFLGFRNVVTQSVGTGVNDGWVPVAQVLADDWNPPGSGLIEMVHVLWASIGDLFVVSSTNLDNTLEITIGTHVNPLPSFAQKIRLDAQLQNRNAVPVFWTLPFVTGSLGLWGSNNRPCIWARISTNGGPASGAQMQFAISHVGILSFYHSALNAYKFAARQVVNAAIPGSTPVLAATFSPPASALKSTGKYLGFCAVRHSIYDGASFARFDLGWNDASTATRTQLLGNRAGDTNPTNFRWGQEFFGQPGFVPCVFSTGAWFTVEGLDSGDTLDLVVRPQLIAQGGVVQRVESVDLFLVHEENFGSFASQQQTRLTGFDVHNDFNVSPQAYEPLEVTLIQQQDHVAIACSKLWIEPTTPRGASFQKRVTLAGALSTSSDLYSIVRSNREGVWNHTGSYYRLPLGGARIESFAVRNPLQSNQGQVHPTDEFCVAAWMWENNPNFTPSNPPAVTPATWLTVDRESLAVGSLLAIPIEPVQSQDESVELPRSELVADDQTKITWPSYLTLRRSLTLTWTGLSLAERDTLIAFFAANRTFKWTPPGETTPLALLASKQLSTVDTGSRRASMSISALQLIWVGP